MSGLDWAEFDALGCSCDIEPWFSGNQSGPLLICGVSVLASAL